jgi:hypothetical protein
VAAPGPNPILNPNDALVTGYDFLIDQATAITNSLAAQGIANQTQLINNSWTAAIFSDTLFNMSVAPDLLSLNSHFEHYRFFPNDPADIYASQITNTTDFQSSLVFSVGCHSGLSVTDADSLNGQTATDWPQAFLRQQAIFIGNTGFGYGDSDLVAYSERVMVNFVESLGDWSSGPQTVGGALIGAKQRYFNSLAAGTFSNYDEKVLSEMTLYGLPMQRINMPITTTVPLAGRSIANGCDGLAKGESWNPPPLLTSTVNLSFTFDAQTGSAGNYFTVAGENDVYVAGGRPIQPRASYNIHITDTIAHGALLVGGIFTDMVDFDPFVSRVLTDEQYIMTEPDFGMTYLYPVGVGTVNRFLGLDGQSYEQLVVVPGQFKSDGTSSPTRGTERLYTDLQFEVYHVSVDNTDFDAPRIWHVEAERSNTMVNFTALVQDDIGAIPRVVVLYREAPATNWQMVELSYDPLTQLATGSAESLAEETAYFVQAVDGNGNVALALDHGNEFVLVGGPTTTPTPTMTTTPTATPVMTPTVTPTATAVPPTGEKIYLPFIEREQ